MAIEISKYYWNTKLNDIENTTKVLCLVSVLMFCTVIKALGNQSAVNSSTTTENDYTYELVDVKPLTPEGMHATSIQWSPDGKKIAFTLDKGLYVHVLDLSTREVKPVSQPDEGYSFHWSPDSKRILFYRGKVEFDDKTQIRDTKYWGIIVDIDNKTKKEFESQFKAAPVEKWTEEDGIVVRSKGRELKSIDETGKIKPINEKEKDKFVVYIDRQKASSTFTDEYVSGGFVNNVWIKKVNGSVNEQLTKEGGYYGAALSPNGKYVLAYAQGKHNGKGVYLTMVMDLQGRKIMEIKGSGNEVEDAHGNLGWSLDSRFLIGIKEYEESEWDIKATEIVLFDVENKKKYEITHTPNVVESSPSLSPDNKYVVFTDYSKSIICIGKLVKKVIKQ
ncbi:MAG: hypothetical protein WC955_00620 [Elusimicrobiota bacterium]